MKRSCVNCKYFHGVHQFVKNGKLNWFDSIPDLRDDNGNDVSINAYRCTKFCDIGDELQENDIRTEGLCDEFEPVEG